MRFSQKDKHGLTLIGGSALAFLAVFAAYAITQSGTKPGPDGCFENVSRSTVILLDRSDSTPLQTRSEIHSRAMQWIRDSVQQGERVSVYSADASSLVALVPTFSRCRPQSRGNIAFEDDARIRRTFDSSFVTPLSNILNSPDGTSGRSPIAQAIIDLSLSAHLRADTVALLVFSDLLEHDPPRFSLYSCNDPSGVVNTFRRGRTGMKERPEFRNLRVALHIVPRAGISQSVVRCRDTFWLWFLGDNTGDHASVDVQYLPGGATL